MGEHRSAPPAKERGRPPPPRAGAEGVMEEESAPRAPVVEETCVPEPIGAGDDGVVAAVIAQTAPENLVPVVQLPESNE